MEETIVIRLFELAATVGVGTVFGAVILHWLLKNFARKFDELTAVLLGVVRSLNTLSMQHMLHEAMIHGVNESAGANQDERTLNLQRRIDLIVNDMKTRNEEIDRVIHMLTERKT